MRKFFNALAVVLIMSGGASAEPFKEMIVGVPVSSIVEAEAWYAKFFGSDTEVIKPFPGVVEFKVAPDAWVQLYETEEAQSSGTVIRFLVDDMANAQEMRANVGIDTGEAIEVPGVVTFSEFVDPYGNALGFYDLP